MKSHLLPTLGLPPHTSDSLILGTASLGSFGLSSHLVMVVLPLTCFHGCCGCLEHARPFLKLPLGSLAKPPFVNQVLIFQFLSFVLLSLFVLDQLWGCCWCVWGLSGTWRDRSMLTPGSHVTHQCFWWIWSGHSAKAIHTYVCGYPDFCIPVCSTGAFARWLSCTPPWGLHQ